MLSALAWTCTGLYFAAALLMLGLRYWLLPHIAEYTGTVERALSRSIGERVTIGGIQASWHGLRPQLNLTNLRIQDRSGRAVLTLPGVDATVSWTSVAFASIHFYSLVFDEPDLQIRRDASGRIFIAGMELKGSSAGSHFPEWLLSQREIVIRNARLSWDDQLRAAPRLDFTGLTLTLQNSGELHRFALRAHTDKQLASGLDLRGELRGSILEPVQRWTGRLYAELDYTDLSAWQQWFDYPVEIRSGRGAVRLWLGFAGMRLTSATADVALADVTTRLSSGLPLLELDYLEGRLGGRQTAAGYEVFGRQLAFKTAAGSAFSPADFTLKWEPARGGRASRGELSASLLELQPLEDLAEFLPLPQGLRTQLSRLEPRGSVRNLKLTWEGNGEIPGHYSVRGLFSNVGVNASLGVPGFSGMSGRIDANEKGGNLTLDARNVAFELPDILAEGELKLDTLSGRIGWMRVKGGVQFRFGNIALASPDISGTLSGKYATASKGPGTIDLTGSFSHLKGASAYRLIPGLPPPVRDYLKSALRAGNAYDISLRLKGDLDRFPFATPQDGSFRIAGKVAGVDFDYARGWPGLKNISADVVFDGLAMRIAASRASVMGVQVSNAKARIDDLFHDHEVLQVQGSASGPSASFLKFVDASPVKDYIDHFTEGMRATGNASLHLSLLLPIRRLEQAKVAGSLKFDGNSLVVDADVPAFSQLGGRIDFTRDGVSARDITCRFLGGPTRLSVATSANGTVTVSADGTATVAALRPLADIALLDHASGSTPWNGSIAFTHGTFDMRVESSLRGVALSLPAPLDKPADETLPLHLTRTNSTRPEVLRRLNVARLPQGGDAIAFSLGQTINGVIVRAHGEHGMVIDRGALSLNESTPPLDHPGIVVSGWLPSLDLDRWRALFAKPAPAATTLPPLAAVNLRVGVLELFSRQFHDLNVRATRAAGLWNAAINAREIAGTMTWRPEGRGRIVARLSHLTIPHSEDENQSKTAGKPSEPSQIERELPALDVVADDFVLGSTRLGKLKLVALNQGRDWRIEQLVLSVPEATLTADGYWQSWAARPSTQLNLKLDVSDAGKYLARLGYPGTVSGGIAHLQGTLDWAGSPLHIDYPSLTGSLSLKVEKGRFLKADPGVAKLLGILSLQSLQSLLSFDLRDLFSNGFAFDTISSKAEVKKGVLSTHDFDMRGASARVAMTGQVNLDRETENLRLRVVPALGDSAATAATLLLKINPITGLGALLAQRLFKDPLGQIFAFEYTVTGTWSNPKVEKAQVEPLDFWGGQSGK